jgi:hypothetical protein
MENDRLFRWLDHLVAAPSREEARRALLRRLSDTAEGSWEALGTDLRDALCSRTPSSDPPYDAVDPLEYLHAVPPGEQVEVPSWALPREADPLVPESSCWNAHGGIETSGFAEARTWARLLPSGAVICLEP